MRKTKVLTMAALAVVTSAAVIGGSIAVFADDTGTGVRNTFCKLSMKGPMNIDSGERLEKQKENISKRVEEGKLTQEEADKRIAEIDSRIKEIQSFNSMTLDQKKEKLLNHFTSSINEKVKDSKLTQEKADQILADFKVKLDAWDGNGSPAFIGKEFMGKKAEMVKGEDRQEHKARNGMPPKAGAGHAGISEQTLNKQKENIQQKVQDGKLTQEEADKLIAKIEEKIKQIQDFNSMSVEQKKEKLLNDLKASVEDKIKNGKLTQEKADQKLADYKTRLDKWDGSGEIPFPEGKMEHQKGVRK